MKIVHKKSQFVFGNNIKHADGFFSRLKGLMFVDEMKDMDGLLLEPANSIHNCFVRFPIDVVFLSHENRIVKIIRGFKPWRFTRMYFTARKVLELPNGTIPQGVSEGDELEVIYV